MTISGNHETRVRPTSWQSSDFNAGIPIKKRKFFIQPLSPPTEEASSMTQENLSECKEQSSSSQGSPISNASNIAASVFCSSDANENTVPQEKESSDIANPVTVPRIVEHRKVKIEEPSPSVQSVSLSNIENRENLVEAKSSDVLVSSKKTEMKLAPTENNIAETILDQPKVKIEEPSLPVQYVCLADVEIKEKLVEVPSSSITIGLAVQSFSLADVKSTDKFVESKRSNILVSAEKTEMKLAPTVGTAHDMHSEKTYGNQKAEGECRSKLSTGSRNTEFPLGCTEHLIPVVAGQSSCQYQENVEPLSLNLSLSKGESSTQNKSDISICTRAGVDNGINRSNWDLNTTMDTWEGSLDGNGAGQVSFACIDTSSGTHDVKPSSSSDRMVSASFISEGRGKEKVEYRSDTATTSSQSNLQYNSGCSLSLGLTSFCLLEKSSSSSASLDRDRAGYMCLSSQMMPSGNSNAVNLRTVKSEPLDEIVRQELDRAKVSPLGLSNNRLKHELAERCNEEAGFSSVGFLKSTDPTPTNPEPANGVQWEALTKNEGTSNQQGKVVHSNDIQELPNCSTSNELDKEKPNLKDSGRVPTCLKEMAINSGEMNCSNQNNSAAYEKSFKTAEQGVVETISSLVGHDSNWNVSVVTGSSLTEVKSLDDCKSCRLKEPPLDSYVTEESSQSDEEKINLSGDMLEEDLCGSDYESDGGHDLSTANKMQDDKTNEYEDGEVRGSVAFFAEENTSTKKCEVEHACNGDSENKNTEIAGLTGHGFSNPSHIEENATEAEVHDVTSNDDVKECVDASHDEKIKNHADEDACWIESVEMPTGEVEIKRHIMEIQRKPLDVLEEKDAQKIQEGERLSYQIVHASQGISGASIGSDENVQNPDMVEENNSSASYKAEISTIAPDSPKDSNSGASQSRIINLTRVSSKSPGKTLDVSGSLLPLRTGRERLPDLQLEAESFLSRGRDVDFIDNSYKFARERHRDQLTRNPRFNYVSDRRRVSSRINTNLRDCDSENIGFDNYGNAHKDGAFARSFCRGGRLSNEAKFFSQTPSRKRSPSFSFMRRDSRNMSPDRGAADDGSAFHGHRNGKNFMRRLPRNNMDPAFTQPQHRYDELDGQFVREHKNYSSIQRSGLPQFRSRSPIRSKARSHGSCSSFRSRSPDGFVGPPDLHRRRSPPSYRRGIMRSFDHSCFSRDIVIRRDGSPPYSSRPLNAPRDMDSGRGRGYRRSGVFFRNPSDRILLRRQGKFDMLDHRESTNCDDFFEGPIHSGRFDEFEADGNIERRRFSDGRECMRSFRPSFSGDGCEPSSVEDDPGAIRFCQENDAEIDEQRELDRGNKNRAGDAPRRARNIEEKEGSSRDGRDIWHEEFDGISRSKRKRF